MMPPGCTDECAWVFEAEIIDLFTRYSLASGFSALFILLTKERILESTGSMI